MYQPKNYGNMIAANQYAAQAQQMAAPYLKMAQETGNETIKNAVADKYIQSGIPQLVTMGTYLKESKFIGKDKMTFDFDFSDADTLNGVWGLYGNGLKAIGYDKDSVAGKKVSITMQGQLGGSMFPAGLKEKELKVGMKSNESKIWWTKDGHSAVIFDPVTEEYSDAEGNLLTKDQLEERPKQFAPKGSNSPVSETDIRATAEAIVEKRRTLASVQGTRGVRDQVGAMVDRITDERGLPRINHTGDTNDAGAAKSSQAFVTKQLDMTQSFTRTLDLNIDQLDQHIATMATRHNLPKNKIMMMGWREFMSLAGDSDINIYDMLTSSISTENAKLQQGGAGSVAQVAAGAAEKMDKIHNKNLPVAEMVKLMQATRKEGGNRERALVEQLKIARGRSNETRPAYPKKEVGSKPKNLEHFMFEAKKSGSTATDDELKAYYMKTYGGR
jgi:hypothetical protein